MDSTKLSTILNRMNAYQDIETIETQYKVEFLDSSLRDIKRKIKLPWMIKKSTVRIFDDVLEYPVASDHDEVAFLDNQKNENIYAYRARFRYSNIKSFYENSDRDRNNLATIWDQGTKYLGVRYDVIGRLISAFSNRGSIKLTSCEDNDKVTVSGDANSSVKDTVVFKEGSASIRVVITNSTNVATFKYVYETGQTNAKYKSNYFFKRIYLGAVPTSIDMRLQVNDSNYIHANITTQFSGQAFKANDWNWIAIDLNTATEVGTISTASIWASEKIILNGAPSGTYYFDASYMKEWALLDYWYYSNNQVIQTGESVATQDYFKDSDGIYESDSELVGEEEYADVAMYKALMKCAVNLKNNDLQNDFEDEFDTAMDRLIEKYPDLIPLETGIYHRFENNPGT